MKVLVMAHRPDETEIFHKINENIGLELTFCAEQLTPDNKEKMRGFDALIINAGCELKETLAECMKRCGINYIVTRTAGTDHIDKEALAKYGLKCANVPNYSPNAISEHTVLLILSLLRKMKLQMHRMEEHYFFLNGLRGRELKSMTVGVIGTGRIGTATVQNLSGFGCRILVNGHHPNLKVNTVAYPVSREELLRESDIVVLHCPMSKENYHMINRESLNIMKPSALLINTARGSLVDTGAVIEALEQRRLGGFAMDVYEFEERTQRKDYRDRELDDPLLTKLLSMDNVIYTTHTAFYTEQAIENIIETSMKNLEEFFSTGTCENEI